MTIFFPICGFKGGKTERKACRQITIGGRKSPPSLSCVIWMIELNISSSSLLISSQLFEKSSTAIVLNQFSHMSMWLSSFPLDLSAKFFPSDGPQAHFFIFLITKRNNFTLRFFLVSRVSEEKKLNRRIIVVGLINWWFGGDDSWEVRLGRRSAPRKVNSFSFFLYGFTWRNHYSYGSQCKL